MTQYIIIAVLIVIATTLTIASANQQKRISEQIDLANRKAKEKDKTIVKLESDIDTLIGRQIKGYPQKFFIAFTYGGENHFNDGVAVCADYKTKDGTQTVAIKSFPYGDDDKFAIMEAEELLDHLNEK